MCVCVCVCVSYVHVNAVLLTMSGHADKDLVSRPHPLVTPTGEFPMNVPYKTLLEVTGEFSQVPYEEGGHKLGEGGSGEVFHCTISTGQEEHGLEVAVKVLGNRAGTKVRLEAGTLCDCHLPTHCHTHRTRLAWLTVIGSSS